MLNFYTSTQYVALNIKVFEECIQRRCLWTVHSFYASTKDLGEHCGLVVNYLFELHLRGPRATPGGGRWFNSYMSASVSRVGYQTVYKLSKVVIKLSGRLYVYLFSLD